MKKVIVLCLLLLSGKFFSIELPLSKGVNLANWFQADNVKSIRLNTFTKADLEDIKSLGIDHIRLPINLEFMTDGAPNYEIDPLFFTLLDEVVNWADELNLYLILDNHTFDVNSNTSANYDDVLIPIWQQMAEHYKNNSSYLIYEILNEPHGINNALWNSIQKNVLDAIRDIDSTHTIIVTGANWSSYNNLSAIPVFDDDNLIYTFHFYDPFLFTHQGATWSGRGLELINNIPFPYDASSMPQLPEGDYESWIVSSYNNYHNDGTVSKVKSLIDIAHSFSEARNVQVYCGELGVYIPNSPVDDRVEWYRTVCRYLDSLDIPWTIWDYKGEFGLFEKGSSGLFDYDLNVPLLEAIGLNVPPQEEYVIIPDSSQIKLYSDYVGENIELSFYGESMVDLYNEDVPDNNRFSLLWKNAVRYNSLRFEFNPNKDLSYLVDNNYVMSFWIKGNSLADSLDMRFVNFVVDSGSDKPWRMRYIVDNDLYASNDTWTLVEIPLNDFYEQGTVYNNTWYDPIGEFEWNKVDYFEIVAEHKDFDGAQYSFADIKIYDPTAVSVEGEISVTHSYQLMQNYPNPFNPVTSIEYQIPKTEEVSIMVYDMLGREIATLVNETQSPGTV